MKRCRTLRNRSDRCAVGPTASGKSALAMDLAQRFDMEIVNADAFCLYRGMDIGTAEANAVR